MIIAFINYVRELSIFTICHPVKLRHSQKYITTAQGGGFLRGNKISPAIFIYKIAGRHMRKYERGLCRFKNYVGVFNI